MAWMRRGARPCRTMRPPTPSFPLLLPASSPPRSPPVRPAPLKRARRSEEERRGGAAPGSSPLGTPPDGRRSGRRHLSEVGKREVVAG